MNNKSIKYHRASGKSQYAVLIIVSVVTSVLGLLFLLGNSQKSFPSFPSGIYVGKVTDGGIGRSSGTTLYIEKPKGKEVVLVAVFKEGWLPQILTLNKLDYDDSDKTALYQPVKLKHEGRSFAFSGSASKDVLSGEVLSSDGLHGTWTARRQKAQSLVQLANKLRSRGGDLDSWLPIRRELRLLEDKFHSLQIASEKTSSNIQHMQTVLADKNRLKERSRAKLKNLVDKVQLARKEREKYLGEVNNLVGELDLLGRITSKGKVVRLARKIASRENKWYLVNWGAPQQAYEVAEEEYAENMNIDVKQLSIDYAKAREVRSMQRELKREREMLTELRHRMQSRIKESEDKQTSKAKRKRGFFDKIFR